MDISVHMENEDNHICKLLLLYSQNHTATFLEMKTVLFLCTGNSCRSQMAEAIVNTRYNNEWKAYSAGTKPTGFIHLKAIQALNEIGIAHMGRSKHIDD